MRILIVDDEAPMRAALEQTLRSEGFKVASAADGEAGLELALAEPFDLILLDVMMPKLDGFAVCQSLRQYGSKVPILMLTAKGQVDDRVTGLESGADDYLTKPFSLKELLARVHALLRRFQRSEPIADPYPLGDGQIQFSKRRFQRGGEEHDLTEKEVGMLKLLIEAEGEPVSREKFLDRVWGYEAYPSTRTVDNFVLALRKKIEPDPSTPRHLLTIRGYGYRLAP
jgi:DNA-binding response OmpR family regulator